MTNVEIGPLDRQPTPLLYLMHSTNAEQNPKGPIRAPLHRQTTVTTAAVTLLVLLLALLCVALGWGAETHGIIGAYL